MVTGTTKNWKWSSALKISLLLLLLIYISGTPDSEPFQHQIWLGVSQSSRHKDQMLYICNLLQTAITVGKYCGMTESYLNNQPTLSDVCRANSKPLLFIVKILLKTQMIKSYLNIANPLWCMLRKFKTVTFLLLAVCIHSQWTCTTMHRCGTTSNSIPRHPNTHND